MDALTKAQEARRPSDPEARLCRRVQSEGRIALARVTREVIRDKDARLAAIDSAVRAGAIRIDIIETGSRPRVELVWVG